MSVDKGEVHASDIGSVRVYIQSTEGLHIGQRIKVEGKVSYYEHATNPGQFDAYDFYHCRGQRFDLYEGRILTKGRQYFRLRDMLYRIRS